MSFTFGVGIPEDASHGDLDVVTVTAASRASPAVSDSSVLTTTATTQPRAYGVTVEPSWATGHGDPGDTLTYTLQVTNSGTVADTFSLGYSAPSTWTVSLSSSALGLGAGDELRAPLAVTVIGGLTVATLLTLVFIPCMYRVFSTDRKREEHAAAAEEGA